MTVRDVKSYYELARRAREEWISGNSAIAMQLYELITRNKELEDLVRRDPFTRLYNKETFLAELRANIVHSSETHQPLGLVILDIDNFKRVNDTYGHPTGDVVLRYVSDLIRAHSRSSDIIAARIGGEEFAVIAPLTDEKGIAHFGDKLRSEISDAVLPDGLKALGKITVSAGAVAMNPGDTPEVMYKRADAALYKAKRSGKNLCYVLKSREVA